MFEALFPYDQTTHDITVRVAVSFQPGNSDPAQRRWLWTYHIRLENHGDIDVQLVDRHWTIIDGDGEVSRVDGPGVVGDQPVLAPGKSYDYVSGVPLATSSGLMRGYYGMIDASGRRFDVMVPEFVLLDSVVSQ